MKRFFFIICETCIGTLVRTENYKYDEKNNFSCKVCNFHGNNDSYLKKKKNYTCKFDLTLSKLTKNLL